MACLCSLIRSSLLRYTAHPQKALLCQYQHAANTRTL